MVHEEKIHGTTFFNGFMNHETAGRDFVNSITMGSFNAKEMF